MKACSASCRPKAIAQLAQPPAQLPEEPRKEREDELSAVLILQAWLDRERGPTGL